MSFLIFSMVRLKNSIQNYIPFYSSIRFSGNKITCVFNGRMTFQLFQCIRCFFPNNSLPHLFLQAMTTTSLIMSFNLQLNMNSNTHKPYMILKGLDVLFQTPPVTLWSVAQETWSRCRSYILCRASEISAMPWQSLYYYGIIIKISCKKPCQTCRHSLLYFEIHPKTLPPHL